MALKDMLVIVDDPAASATRIAVAADLARRHDAHLTGLCVVGGPFLPAHVAAEMPISLLQAERRARLDRAEDARAAFDERMRAHGLEDRSEWRMVEGDPGTLAAIHGRYADLIVVGQTDPDRDGDLPGATPDDLLFSAGRPILVVPHSGQFVGVGARVVVAWNGGREAARAVGDALPFLERAERVILMAVNPEPGAAGLGDEPCADIARHLSHHGCRVEATHVITPELDPGAAILNTVTDESCDLVVMGAYGHSRLRELVLGGMTRYMLHHMTVPVLMSH